MYRRVLCAVLLGAALMVGCDTSSPGSPTAQPPQPTPGSYPYPYPAPSPEQAAPSYPEPTLES